MLLAVTGPLRVEMVEEVERKDDEASPIICRLPLIKEIVADVDLKLLEIS